ncbi:hypothetical protein SISSUDRAFT_1047204, partial [Sistotremastrum suecicum HHB10207 ss-3]
MLLHSVALLLCTFGLHVRASSSPDSFGLIYPGAPAVVGENITIGIEPPSGLQGWPFNISIVALLPNGTTTPIFSASSFDKLPDFASAIATPPPSAVSLITGILNLSLVGIYQIDWSLTYYFSSDPSQANGTYLGPGPFSSQTWVLQRNLTAVNGTGSGSSGIPPQLTVTTELPSLPTANLPKYPGIPSAASQIFSSVVLRFIVVCGLLWTIIEAMDIVL